MMIIKRLVICLLGVLMTATAARAADYSAESLDYKVMYKWGLVHKQAGHATLSIKRNGDRYATRLTAASEKWADRFFKVRDTLSGTVMREGLKPLIYEKISNEGGERKHDIVRYSYKGSAITGNCHRRQWDKKGRKEIDDTRTLTSTGTTLDMLSSFYYMRDLPYASWKTGHTVQTTVFSGKRKEILTITYLGRDKVSYDKKTFECFHIRFSFKDPDSKKESSDGMDAWISTDARHIPVKLEGKLKVGKVQCFYTGQ